MRQIDLGGGFTVTGREWNSYLRWEVTGRLDLHRTPRLMELVREACHEGYRRHLIDLSGVGVVDATMVRELVSLHKQLGSTGRLVVAARPGEAPRMLLSATLADRILEVYDDPADSVDGTNRI